jgi:hypothetical protein
MSVFTLHSNVVADYRDFVRSFFSVAADRAREFIALDPADLRGPDLPCETFRVLKEKETAKFGEYRTRRLVLEAWDKLVQSKEMEKR